MVRRDDKIMMTKYYSLKDNNLSRISKFVIYFALRLIKKIYYNIITYCRAFRWAWTANTMFL